MTDEEFLKARLAQREAMADPEQWAPITRQGTYTLTVAQLEDTLDGANIFGHTDYPGFEFIEGWLSPAHGGFAFFAVKPVTEDGVCMMAVPHKVERM